MCGRYGLYRSKMEYENALEAAGGLQSDRERGPEYIKPNYNVTPTHTVLIARREGKNVWLGLDNAGDLAVHIQQIVGVAGLERKLAHGHPRTRHDVHGLVVLDEPAARLKLAIDLLPGFFLGGHGYELLVVVRGIIPSDPNYGRKRTSGMGTTEVPNGENGGGNAGTLPYPGPIPVRIPPNSAESV